MILGHARPEVLSAVHNAACRGFSFGAPTEAEIRIAEEISRRLPSVEMVRLVSSGTEAAMSAIRLARGHTDRRKILKFEGCYHGHADCLLVKAGSGAATIGVPDSAGVTSGATQDTLVATYNDIASVQEAVEKAAKDLACIIVEPVAGNMGCVPPSAGFLQFLRDSATDCGALLIFDEVMTGFRVGLGGAQELYSIRPDLTVMGKVLGGGLPLGAFGGSREIMQGLAPGGSVYQAGTLSGNPLAVAAGLAQLALLNADAYERLESLSAELEAALLSAAEQAGVDARVQRVGSMLSLFFAHNPITNFKEVAALDPTLFASFHKLMLHSGVYLPPSRFESWFVSTSHTQDDIQRTGKAALSAFSKMKKLQN